MPSLLLNPLGATNVETAADRAVVVLYLQRRLAGQTDVRKPVVLRVCQT